MRITVEFDNGITRRYTVSEPVARAIEREGFVLRFLTLHPDYGEVAELDAAVMPAVEAELKTRAAPD